MFEIFAHLFSLDERKEYLGVSRECRSSSPHTKERKRKRHLFGPKDKLYKSDGANKVCTRKQSPRRRRLGVRSRTSSIRQFILTARIAPEKGQEIYIYIKKIRVFSGGLEIGTQTI